MPKRPRMAAQMPMVPGRLRFTLRRHVPSASSSYCGFRRMACDINKWRVEGHEILNHLQNMSRGAAAYGRNDFVGNQWPFRVGKNFYNLHYSMLPVAKLA